MRTLRIVVLAGLFAAAVEMAFVLPIQLALGNAPLVVFQSIASGCVGPAAFDGGATSAALGVVVHVALSLAFALVYAVVASRLPRVDERPIAGGLALGVVAYVAMTFVVVPLSRIGFHGPKSATLFLLSFAVHLVGFGIPIALAVARLRRGAMPR